MEIRSVTKAIKLLEELGREAPQGVSELARQVEMDKSSVSRMLRTLEQAGFVQQDPASQRYGLGLALVHLGQRALRRIDLRGLSKPALEALAARTGECAHLAILTNGRAFYLEQAAPDRGVNVEAPVGTLAPLHCTALGKALLAFQPPDVLRSLIEAMDFELFTRRTIRDGAALTAHLQGVVRTGVAHDDEEFSVGVRCLAAPVFRHDGTVCGAIGVSGPSPRVTDDRVAEWEQIVREEAQRLSVQLGWPGPDAPAKDSRPPRGRGGANGKTEMAAGPGPAS